MSTPNPDAEIINLIRSYRFTVMVLAGCIILTMLVFAWVMLVHIPALISEQRAEEAPALIKQALTEYFAENEVMITTP